MEMAPTLPSLPEFIPGVLMPAETQVPFPANEGYVDVPRWSFVNAEEAREIIVSSKYVQEATGLDRQGLVRRFSVKWTVDMALNDCKANCLTLITFLIQTLSSGEAEQPETEDGRWFTIVKAIACPYGY
jgi:hypothetical protein